jgi:hypothetical protein
MRPRPPDMQTAPGKGAAAEANGRQVGHSVDTKNSSSNQALVHKSETVALRIGIVEWRGRSSVEIRECTAVIAGKFWPTSTGVQIEVAKLPELIAALKSIEAAARARGLLA